MSHTRRIVVLSFLLASAAMAGGQADAQTSPSQPPKAQLKPCLAKPANKTLTHALNGSSVEAKSGTAYVDGDCDHFIVDVVVTGASYSDKVSLSTDPVNGLDSKASFEAFVETWEVHKTNANGGATRVGGGSRHGKWTQHNKPFGGKSYMACSVDPSPIHQLNRPTNGNATFRVLVSGKKNGQTVPVLVKVSGSGTPPG